MKFYSGGRMGDMNEKRSANILVDIDPKYAKLVQVFEMAYRRASEGKGHQHHSHGEAFEEQWILRGTKVFGIGGPLFQCGKKLEQVSKMERDNYPIQEIMNELLDVMNYSAAVVIYLKDITGVNKANDRRTNEKMDR
jgi:hypothetical protein